MIGLQRLDDKAAAGAQERRHLQRLVMSAEASTDRREFLKDSGKWILLTGAATLAWDFVAEGAPEQRGGAARRC